MIKHSRGNRLIISMLALPLFILASVVSSSRSEAQCNPSKDLYDRSANIFSLDIRRTIDNTVNAGLESAFSKTIGGNLTEVSRCSSYFAGQFGDQSCMILDPACTTTDTTICQDFSNNVRVAYGDPGYTQAFARSRVGGTALGLAYTLNNYNYNEPVPVNVAYYWNRQLAKIPFVGKAYAQTTDYGHGLVNAALVGWQVARDVALAIMAVVFFYTGILIIMRKKVSQQLVVNVQYALPRVALGLVLIVLSYPIGALMASAGWTLFRSGPTIMWNLFSPRITDLVGAFSGAGSAFGIILLVLIILALAIAGSGGVALIITVVVILALLGMYLYLQFKVFMLYLKMVFSVITAPLEFALGTIPGSEDKIGAWFKRMAKYLLTLFLMGLIVPLTLFLGLSIITAYSCGSPETAGMGLLLAVVAPLFLLIYGFGLAIGMEKRVDDFLGTGGKRR